MADAAAPSDIVPAEQRGRTTIADQVVVRIASIATAEVEAVIDTRRGWTKLVRKALPHAEAVVAGETSRITVEVAATWPLPLPRVAAQVREHVAQQVTALTGIAVTRVDVRVADVMHVESAGRRVE